jgi:hypothetical protein
MPELLVLAFFLNIFLYKYAGTISSGVFLNFFYINMPELLVPAFFLFFLYKYTGTTSSGVFFIFFI